ncbi:MAG TPA: PAS domain S-box protein [Kofleriaceae bacterium]|nr:PAS domain S-box protein [Kofleriaceae bacterium]
MGTEDPYRTLFLQLRLGAARCRVKAAPGAIVDVELLEENPAFAPFRGALSSLHEVIGRGRHEAATAELRVGERWLAVSALPVGPEEVMVVVEDVTARVTTAQRLREAQIRFEQAFHGNAAAMVIARQSDLCILDVNARWLELFAAKRADVIGHTAVDLGLITAQRASARIVQHQALAEGHDVELELVNRRGEDLVVLASARPIEIPEGRCTLTTLIDLTGRKHAEQAFALVFSASPAGMMLVEVESDLITAVNTRLLEMTGMHHADLVGRRSFDAALSLRPPREELLAEVARSGRLAGVELELASKHGRGVWTLASTELVTLHGKSYRLSVFTDISARKRLERHLLTRHVVGYALAEAVDLDAAIPHVLEALCRDEDWQWGAMWLHEDVLRCRGTWGDPAAGVGPEGLTQALPAEPLWAQLHATGEPIVTSPGGGIRALALPILRGDAVLGMVMLVGQGELVELDAADRGLHDSIGRLLGLFVERIRAEGSLRELNSELEARVLHRTRELETSNRDLASFGASVSHDLRAPLRAIHGFSEILLEDFATALPAEAQGLLRRIHASAERMRNLIDSLLAFSQIGRGPLTRRLVELDPLVRSVIDELLISHKLADRLDLDVHALGTCWADPTLLRAVWTNLIGNALKYARDRERVKLGIGRELRDGEVIYYVSDNGVGFDMADAERLFGVFQRLHSEFEGVGLGLANVRRIIERHNGWVSAKSRVGCGSRFEFTLGPEYG